MAPGQRSLTHIQAHTQPLCLWLLLAKNLLERPSCWPAPWLCSTYTRTLWVGQEGREPRAPDLLELLMLGQQGPVLGGRQWCRAPAHRSPLPWAPCRDIPGPSPASCPLGVRPGSSCPCALMEWCTCPSPQAHMEPQQVTIPRQAWREGGREGRRPPTTRMHLPDLAALRPPVLDPSGPPARGE